MCISTTRSQRHQFSGYKENETSFYFLPLVCSSFLYLTIPVYFIWSAFIHQGSVLHSVLLGVLVPVLD